MNISSISAITGQSAVRQSPALPKLDTGGFSALLEKTKKASEAAAAEKVKASMERESEEKSLEQIYTHLSDSAKRTLERLKEDRNVIRKEEWLELCRELKDAGAITQCDFDYTRGDLHLIPMGYHNKSGKFIQYSTPPILLEKLRALSAQAQAKSGGHREVRLSTDSWRGNPLEYLSEWSSMLAGWRNSMAGGIGVSRRIEDFSPIDDQIDSCRKVSGLIRQLTAISGQERSL